MTTTKTISKIKKIIKAAIALALSLAIIYGYSRGDYKHWIDADKNCRNTREEVLIVESLEKPELDKKGCRVIKGKWYDPYTDQYFTNPNDLDVDHFVPLKEVDRSGGHDWSREQKMQYANDLTDPKTLIAVSKSANRSKADKDPAVWLPPNKKYQCEYIKNWQEVKKKWDLKMDEKERDFIIKKNKECGFESRINN
jgi:hypothetical protein